LLALKLLVVPGFLLLLSLAGNRWGPSVAGWLAGLPVVAGPILYFIALERGHAFAAEAASAALAAVFASVTFSVAYAYGSRRARWPFALLLGLIAWTATASLLAVAPDSLIASFAVAASTLIAAPFAFPAAARNVPVRAVTRPELAVRMAAGALLTLADTVLAAGLGPRWSGLLAVFPVLAIALAVFSHRSQGHAFSTALLRAMATGLYSFLAFCFVLALALPRAGTAWSFGAAVMVCLAVQAVSRRFLAT
jgi:uncharacterized membrane protein (GlpM family)